jgi:signal transduction histidine kinase
MSFVKNDQVDRILAVDDTPDNLILVQTLLESEGYEVDLVSNGETALKKVMESPPDLILLDVMMPGMDGYEVTRRIRKNLETNYIPILLITASLKSSVVEGLDAGADDFIRKPFDTEELLARVRSLLRLKHSIDEQQRMTYQREDFVSRLTHDLRTPLVAADRMLTLFQQGVFGEIPPTMQEPISVMIRSNQNLMQMVNTLLEVYRFEAGKKQLNLEKIDLKEIAQEIIDEITPLALEKNLTLKLDTQKLIPTENNSCMIFVDKLEIRRVLNNIIANAIKFTDTGGVEVSIFRDNNSVALAVTDTGHGIPPEEQAAVFERFRQGKNKRSGSGLGLHLSQRILEAHGGQIELQSEYGRGSVFTIRLPKTT